MPEIKIEIEQGRFTAKLDAITPGIHEALVKALGPLAKSIAADAMSRAQAHIRYLGKKPGFYLASIYGGVADGGQRVVGYVRSGNPLAHLLEQGANVPAHDILPSSADVLAFAGDAGTIFAKAVHSPGAAIPPYPAIEPAFTAAESQIEDTMRRAVQGAMK